MKLSFRSIKSLTFRIGAIALGTTLAACGGGYGSSSSSSSYMTPPPTPASTTLNGSFVDALTMGLTYSASPSGLTGTTSSSGVFQYKAGDTVTLSLNVGGSTPITIGSAQPVAPASGNVQLFVLSLQNGLQVAQVLQSLNHSASSGVIDVSGLMLSAAAVAAINAYTSSGGVTLPTGQTDVQMLAAAQSSNTAAGTTFTMPGGASIAETLTNLNSTITAMTSAAGVSLSSLLPGKTVFYQGILSQNGTIGYSTGFIYFSSSSDTENQTGSGGTITAGTYGTSGNVLTITNSGAVSTITIAYEDASQGLWSDMRSDGLMGSGSWDFIDTTFSASTIAGQTLTLNGITTGACGATPIQLVIDSAGATFTANCQGSSTQVDSGTIAAVASLPGILSFTKASDNGKVHYIGLLAGSSISNGTVAIAKGGIGGLAHVDTSGPWGY